MADRFEQLARKDWNEYFLDLAAMVATRGTCERLQVGAVVVRDHLPLAMGYAGSMRKAPHCEGQEICKEGTSHCQRTVHAEMNAIAMAAREGVRLKDADIYTTHTPCWNCFKVCVNAGIRTFYFRHAYRPDVKTLYNACFYLDGISLVHIPEDGPARTWVYSHQVKHPDLNYFKDFIRFGCDLELTKMLAERMLGVKWTGAEEFAKSIETEKEKIFS